MKQTLSKTKHARGTLYHILLAHLNDIYIKNSNKTRIKQKSKKTQNKGDTNLFMLAQNDVCQACINNAPLLLYYRNGTLNSNNI